MAPIQQRLGSGGSAPGNAPATRELVYSGHDPSTAIPPLFSPIRLSAKHFPGRTPPESGCSRERFKRARYFARGIKVSRVTEQGTLKCLSNYSCEPFNPVLSVPRAPHREKKAIALTRRADTCASC